MKLDSERIAIIIAENVIETKDILAKAKITHKTWIRAKRGENLRAVTAGRIARALNVPIKSLLQNEHLNDRSYHE